MATTSSTGTERPYKIAGKIGFDVPGVNPYFADFVSGGRGKGSMPYGVYPIMPYTPSTPKYGLQGFALNNPGGIMPDPQNPEGRSDIMLHLDQKGRTLDELVSLGCLSVEASDWPALRDQILTLQKQGEKLVVNLQPDGNVTIMRAADVPAGTPVAPSSTSFATATNQTRQDVSTQQAALAQAGFDPGAIDGIAGPQTKSAIMAFQQANGLTADGIVGPQTAAALGSNSALNAIDAAAPGATPAAYAPTPAGLPTMNRSGLIPPIPGPPPTMNRSGPATVQPITLPNGSVVIPGKPYVGKNGSVTTFDAQGNRTHINPPLVNIGEEMGKNTIIGGLARKYGADFMDQGKAAVQEGLSTAGTAAMDLAASLPGKVADLGTGLQGLFGFGAAPKPPLLTPGANAAPSVPPRAPVPPASIPKPVTSLPVSAVPERAPMLPALPAPTVPPPAAFAPFNYSTLLGPNAGVSGMSAPGALPAPAPLVPGPMMTPVAPPPLQQINVAPVAKPRPVQQPSDLDVFANALRSAGITVTGNNKGYVDSSGSLMPTTTMSGGLRRMPGSY